MQKITFISTMHKNHGKCNADELCSILVKEDPEVIFLEAIETTYSNYDRLRFSSFGAYHEKLEIEAIQKYSHHASFKYIPALDNELPESFKKKYESLVINSQLKEMLDELTTLVGTRGFEFLNSQLGMALHKRMRILESQVLNDNELNNDVNLGIDTYENSMMQNIYAYCKANRFNKGVFMCGAAHRESLIEKIRNFNDKEELSIDWTIYGD
ncbi:MAG: hypothetical protein AAFY76_05060 [Cyanobacteria bacterium J06649_11]